MVWIRCFERELNGYRTIKGVETKPITTANQSVQTLTIKTAAAASDLDISDKINKLRIDLIKEELEELTQAINEKDLLCGIFMKGDGQADPIGVTNMLAKAAKEELIIFNK